MSKEVDELKQKVKIYILTGIEYEKEVDQLRFDKSKMREEYKSLDLLYKSTIDSQNELIKSLIEGLGFIEESETAFKNFWEKQTKKVILNGLRIITQKARELLNSEAIKKYKERGE